MDMGSVFYIRQDAADLVEFTCPPLTGVHEFNAVYLKNTDVGSVAEKFMSL